ncbi:hypothetical protein V2J09_013129, partial [Rumex salicifolius]
ENNKQKFDRKCDFCQESGHVRETCFKLVGYPEWWKGLKTQAHGEWTWLLIKKSLEDDDKENFKPDSTYINVVVQEVMKPFRGKQDEASSSRHQNFTGIIHSFSNAYTCQIDHCTWIVISSATDNVSYNKDLFSSIEPLSSPIRIGLPDGTTQLVEQYGIVQISDLFNLKNVLFMLAFKHNLLSVSKLLDDDKHDFTTSKVLDIGKKEGDLYKLSSKCLEGDQWSQEVDFKNY